MAGSHSGAFGSFASGMPCIPPLLRLALLPLHSTEREAGAQPGLTGQRVDALGKPVRLPGPALELAAQHVTIVLLLRLPPLSRLHVRGRLRGFLGRGCGMTRVTIWPSPEARAEATETGQPNDRLWTWSRGDPGVTPQPAVSSACRNRGALRSEPHSTQPDTLDSHQSGTACQGLPRMKCFWASWVFPKVCLCVCVWTPLVLSGGLGAFCTPGPHRPGPETWETLLWAFQSRNLSSLISERRHGRTTASLCIEGNGAGDLEVDFRRFDMVAFLGLGLWIQALLGPSLVP